MHGKGKPFLTMNHAIRMAEIRSTVSSIPLIMLYNIGETGLFYHIGPNRTYLLESEGRRATGGTELQNHKQRITVVFCVKSDGSDALTPNYIVIIMNPRCVRNL